MKRSVLAAVAALAFLCSLWAPRASGQAVYGGILGTVTDPSGAAVARAGRRSLVQPRRDSSPQWNARSRATCRTAVARPAPHRASARDSRGRLRRLHGSLFGLFVRFFSFFARLRFAFVDFLYFRFVVFSFELPDEVSEDPAVRLRRGGDFVRAGVAECSEREHHEDEGHACAYPRLRHRGQSRLIAPSA